MLVLFCSSNTSNCELPTMLSGRVPVRLLFPAYTHCHDSSQYHQDIDMAAASNHTAPSDVLEVRVYGVVGCCSMLCLDL
jgi:hypothetical protein